MSFDLEIKNNIINVLIFLNIHSRELILNIKFAFKIFYTLHHDYTI